MSGIEDFSGFEVVRAAMEVEKQGREFYSSMSVRAHNEMVREIFSLLAQDEIAHLKTLENLVPKFQDGSFWEGEELFLPYLRRFSAEKVFPTPEQVEELLPLPQADLHLLDAAIAAEEKFSAYFQQAAEYCRSADGREAFTWLAGEEERHAAILKARRQKIAGVP